MSLLTQSSVLKTDAILGKLLDGGCLNVDEAEHLLLLKAQDDLPQLREVADILRQRQAGEAVGFVSQVSLYLTNVCEMQPGIYPYPQEASSPKAWRLSIDDIDEALEKASFRDVRQVLLYGGFDSELQIRGLEKPTLLKTYGKLLSHVGEYYPQFAITGFSPDEVEFLAVVSDRSQRYVLEFLKGAGVSSLGGYGAEVLSDAVRQRVSPKKLPVREWLGILELAAGIGLSATGWLEYGHYENARDQARHLELLRQLAMAHPEFLSRFIPQPVPTRLKAQAASWTPTRRLQVLAVCRLFLGEVIPQIQTHWLPDAVAEAQEGLLWGASHAGPSDAMAYPAFLAGSNAAQLAAQSLGNADMERLIQETGRPVVGMA